MGKYLIQLTSAVAIDGAIRPAKALVGVDEWLARDLMRRGKAVLAEVQNAAPQVAKEPDVDLAAMTKAQLADVAAGLGIENAGKMNKTQLLDAITQYEETDQ